MRKRGLFEIHTPTHWKLIGCCACHRPAVFFRHLYIALSFSKKGKVGSLLKKIVIISIAFYFLKCALSLKLHNLKLCLVRECPYNLCLDTVPYF